MLAAVSALPACDRRAATPAPMPAGPVAAPSSVSHPPPARTETSLPRRFVASKHGFGFRNHFPGLGLPTFLVGAEKPGSKPSRGGPAFGLCGGMSAAAADYFIAQQRVPSTTRVPERGSELYEYLYLRQAESIGPGITTALRFVECMNLSDDELRLRTLDELQKIRHAVETHDVAPIGLILARFGGPVGANSPSDNHQVLAIGVHETDGSTVIDVYDPNFPGDDAVRIVFDGKSPGPMAHRVRGPSAGAKPSAPTPVRGVILVPYEPRTPPREPD